MTTRAAQRTTPANDEQPAHSDAEDAEGAIPGPLSDGNAHMLLSADEDPADDEKGGPAAGVGADDGGPATGGGVSGTGGGAGGGVGGIATCAVRTGILCMDLAAGFSVTFRLGRLTVSAPRVLIHGAPKT